MGYVRKLRVSEASLRKQRVKAKQHTEEEMVHSLSKVSELERGMQDLSRTDTRRALEGHRNMADDKHSVYGDMSEDVWMDKFGTSELMR
ncbi:hypothetical protein PRIC1_001242 [Phytophthora ramorum]